MSNNINDLRAHLFEALRAVRSGELDLDKARAVNEISKTLIDSARVEVDYLRTTGEARQSLFIAVPDAEPNNGITGIVRHRLAG